MNKITGQQNSSKLCWRFWAALGLPFFSSAETASRTDLLKQTPETEWESTSPAIKVQQGLSTKKQQKKQCSALLKKLKIMCALPFQLFLIRKPDTTSNSTGINRCLVPLCRMSVQTWLRIWQPSGLIRSCERLGSSASSWFSLSNFFS